MICQKCGKETESLHRIGGFNLCQECYTPMKAKAREEFGQFAGSLPKTVAEKKRDAGQTPASIKPVMKWIQDLIFIEDRIHKASLIGKMADRGYREDTIKSQMKRVERDYFVRGDFVYLSEDIAGKVVKTGQGAGHGKG